MEARVTKVARVSPRFSKSLARRRFRPDQEKVRSTGDQRLQTRPLRIPQIARIAVALPAINPTVLLRPRRSSPSSESRNPEACRPGPRQDAFGSGSQRSLPAGTGIYGLHPGDRPLVAARARFFVRPRARQRDLSRRPRLIVFSFNAADWEAPTEVEVRFTAEPRRHAGRSQASRVRGEANR